ncbi:transglutaminaseTgpA domain-containing protein [Bacillus sp. REN3]|uniref:transglutaminase TgpA family protein n=1 Tax=Bacillus sp. REN3 TaxID=2802440 RepID=UPI001AED61F4|nr:transglutaminaseTgpA domain-containing protein [Bacillus sp. REN3]
MTKDRPKKDFAFFLLYMFSFLLLWEWLRPMKELTETGYLEVFLVFVFLSLVMSFFRMPVIPASFVKVIFVLYCIHFMYYEGTFFSAGWIGQFLESSIINLKLVWGAAWTELSNDFRTLLFFILLWMMAYLIEYWLINRKQIFVFFFMTLVYITVLDTFTPYEANAAIARTVVAGFAVMGMLAFYRIADRELTNKTSANARKWMMTLAAMILFSVGIGYAAPKAEPAWPDPVPFLKSFGNGDGSGGTKKVGYGTDDSKLGGPFIGDDTLVFTAEADSRHYWRVETKDVYTGKGWITNSESSPTLRFEQNQMVPMFQFHPEVKTEQHTSRVNPKIGYPHLVYPLGVSSVEASGTFTSLEFSLNTHTEKILSVANGQKDAIGPYSVTFDSPIYSIEKLQAAGGAGVETNEDLNAAGGAGVETNEDLNARMLSRYTQLPTGLPARIGRLAAEISEKETNWIDKAKAIETYFRSNEFVYDQTQVAVPEENQDYVDQFVFETKRGYCDNFSTSMTVMLRTLGIPARWVKGYTEGEYKETTNNGRRLYEITNNNAHSWVEAYFPGVGWVPFEPTQGFSNTVQFESEKKEQAKTPQEEEKKEDIAPVASNKPEQLEEEVGTAEKKASFSDVFKKAGTSLKTKRKEITLTLLIVAVIAAVLFKWRAKWLPGYYILLYKYRKQDKYLEKAYLALLDQLNRYGLRRGDGQTLRDYANYVDQFFSTREMRRLTAKYEEYLYRGTVNEGMWEEAKDSWEVLIKKAGA